MAVNTRWADIYRHLESKQIKVYSPGTKEGECNYKYTVVINDGTNRHASFSTNISYYSILVYVPKDEYSSHEEYIEEIRKAMKSLEPMILPTGYESPSFYDDEIKAHMVSVQYKNYKKML